MGSHTILVVDDDPDILRILKDNLELDGYLVRSASTGREAVRLFEKWDPAAIVLDRSLPDVDGIQVCRSIRERSAAPIIMVSARDRPRDIALAQEAGADSYLIKPFDYPELAVRLKVFIETWTNCDLRGL